MDKLEEFNRTQQLLLEADVKLRTIQNQITIIEREITTLKAIEANLKENIRWLKKKKIVANLHEYRKVKEQIRTAINRQAILNIDKENVLKIKKHTQAVHEKLRVKATAILDQMQEKDNVIYIDFGNKNGQK